MDRVTKIIGLIAVLVIIASLVQAGPQGFFCAVRYKFTDEKCELCCNEKGLISDSTEDGGCMCIKSIAEQFKEQYPAVSEEEIDAKKLAQEKLRIPSRL